MGCRMRDAGERDLEQDQAKPVTFDLKQGAKSPIVERPRQEPLPHGDRTMLPTKTLFAFAAPLLLGVAPVTAATFEVQMLNKGEAGLMVFEPAFLKLAPGDTVTFLATDAGHNAGVIKDMLPDGAEAFKGAIGEEV